MGYSTHHLTEDTSFALILKPQLDSLRQSLDRAFATQVWEDSDPHKKERVIRQILKSRLARTRYFRGGLFADPAWDMLLELFATTLGQARITVSNLVDSSAVPPTTGLRWMNILISEGLATKEADPFDRRRIYVTMTPNGFRALEEYFRSLPPSVLSL